MNDSIFIDLGAPSASRHWLVVDHEPESSDLIRNITGEPSSPKAWTGPPMLAQAA